MNRVLFLCLLGCASLSGQDLPEKYAPLGQLIITPFASAPFPHPLRAQGHLHDTNFYSATEHYQDSNVALFVPKGFHAGRKIDFVVHFPGWRHVLTNALPKYQLIDQFAASRRNAILIVPQGPYNAADSFDGKLEDEGGFQRFMAEAMATLKQRGIIKSGRIGQIILSSHSGGYQVISSILAWGGLTDHVREVWLFDSLYARTERFVLWFDHYKGRFIDVHTEDGGTKEETQNLMDALRGNKIPFFTGAETNVSTPDLRGNRLIFLFSELPHDKVMQAHQTFRQFLETSALQPVP